MKKTKQIISYLFLALVILLSLLGCGQTEDLKTPINAEEYGAELYAFSYSREDYGNLWLMADFAELNEINKADENSPLSKTQIIKDEAAFIDTFLPGAIDIDFKNEMIFLYTDCGSSGRALGEMYIDEKKVLNIELLEPIVSGTSENTVSSQSYYAVKIEKLDVSGVSFTLNKKYVSEEYFAEKNLEHTKAMNARRDEYDKTNEYQSNAEEYEAEIYSFRYLGSKNENIWLNPDFADANKVKNTAYEDLASEHFVNDSYPEHRSFIIKDYQTYSEVFLDGAIDVDFETEMIVLYTETNTKSGTCAIGEIHKDENNILNVSIVEFLVDGAYGAVEPGQVYYAIKMKKQDISEVNFNFSDKYVTKEYAKEKNAEWIRIYNERKEEYDSLNSNNSK